MARDPVVTPEGWLQRGHAFLSGAGRQLAVFGGIPGERARVRLVGSTGTQDHAKWVAPVGPPHADRVEPSCDRYVPCGRCPLMHLRSEAQDVARRELVDAALAKAGYSLRCEPVVRGGARDVMHTVDLLAGYSDRRLSRLGVRGQDGRDVVPIPLCEVVTPSLRETMKVAAHHMRDLEIWPFDGRQGTLRGVYAREIAGDVLVLLITSRPSPILAEYAARMASGHPAVRGVVVHLNDLRDRVVDVDEDGDLGVSVLYGSPFVVWSVAGLKLRLGVSDAFPGNPDARATVVEHLLDALAPTQGDAVFELDAAEGLLTLRAAQRSGWALGTLPGEGVARRARENAAANGVAAEFAAQSTGGPDVLDVVTPRLEGRRPLVAASVGTKGLGGKEVDKLLALAPRRVVLRSTNPRALAKNLAMFTNRGYALQRVVPVEAAPHSPFVEVLGVLEALDQTPPSVRAPRRRAVR